MSRIIKRKPPAEPPPERGGTRKFLALARVSSREQEQQGFSLDVQEEGLRNYVQRAGGEIVRLHRVAETASKAELRRTFNSMLDEARRRCREIDALVFYKFDRAARNLFDFVELERLEQEYGIRFVSVCEPTENNAAGRMQRRLLGTIATYYTERLADDVREGIARRVRSGLMPNQAPYGYVNVRREGRSVVEVHKEEAAVVRRIFNLYAFGGLTLEGVAQKLNEDSVIFTKRQPRWHAAQVHRMLQNRSYIGEVAYHGQWHPGTHPPIIDRDVWDRVQAMFGVRTYTTHTMTYACGLIRCAHCGHSITGETITKKATGKSYIYYRCSSYTRIAGHPRHRLTEARIDRQVLAMFDRLKVAGPEIGAWVQRVLRAKTLQDRAASRERVEDLERQLVRIKSQRDRLLRMRMDEEIDRDSFQEQDTKLRDDQARVRVLVEAADRGRDEDADVAVKAFELSQHLRDRWVTADYSAKRRILEVLLLNCSLDGVNLAYELRKPFDVLAEGLSVGLSCVGRI